MLVMTGCDNSQSQVDAGSDGWTVTVATRSRNKCPNISLNRQSPVKVCLLCWPPEVESYNFDAVEN